MSFDRGLVQNRNCYNLNLGAVKASHKPAVLRTTLGSCIAVCLYDPHRRIGGMNHFMLPGSCHDETDVDGIGLSFASCFGVNAMELLINECMHLGANRQALVAKVFGGGHVLSTAEDDDSVPRRNVRFVMKFLADERIPVISSNTGGREMRKVFFVTDTGRIYLKRSVIKSAASKRRQITEAEREYELRALTELGENQQSVTLFDC